MDTTTLSGWAFLEKFIYSVFAAGLILAFMWFMVRGQGWKLIVPSWGPARLVFTKAQARLEHERDHPKSTARPPEVTASEAQIAVASMWNLTLRMGFVVIALVVWAIAL